VLGVLIMTQKRRSGFTLSEMLISMTVLAIVGLAFTKILRYQMTYFAHETTLRTARTVARTATNLMLSDLRAVQDSGGVDSVAADAKLVRILVPYRYGLVCATNGSTTTVSLLPSDSSSMGTSVYKGFAFRNPSGLYTYVFPSNPTTSDIPVISTSAASCTGSASGQAQIRTLSVSGRSGDILDLTSSSGSGAIALAPVFLFQKVSYSFRTSGVYPPMLGLWRNVEGGQNEELAAPFDTTARFRFYTTGDDTSRTTPPAADKIRGLELVLVARAPKAASSSTSSNTVKMVTSVFFKNVRSF
jgi:prepilin-type N-terminal cleavage/methylation domain-containing protein